MVRKIKKFMAMKFCYLHYTLVGLLIFAFFLAVFARRIMAFVLEVVG